MILTVTLVSVTLLWQLMPGTSRFPDREAEIKALAQNIVASLAANAVDFPASRPNRPRRQKPPASMICTRDLLGLWRDTAF